MGYQHPAFVTAPPYMRPSIQEMQMMQMQHGMGPGPFMPYGGVADESQGVLGDDEDQDHDADESSSSGSGGKAKSSKPKIKKKKILKCIKCIASKKTET